MKTPCFRENLPRCLNSYLWFVIPFLRLVLSLSCSQKGCLVALSVVEGVALLHLSLCLRKLGLSAYLCFELLDFLSLFPSF